MAMYLKHAMVFITHYEQIGEIEKLNENVYCTSAPVHEHHVICCHVSGLATLTVRVYYS